MASYRLHRGATIGSELRRIAADQTDKALAELEEEPPHEAIHQLRRRCKKVRALLRLVRTANTSLYQHENAAYRDAARRVSELRDATGLIEAFDLMAERHPDLVDTDRFVPIRDGLLSQREERAGHDLDDALAAVTVDLQQARERIVDWDVAEEGFDALAGGLAKTYGRARDRMADAYEERTTAAFHEWRKRVKYHRSHVRLLQDCWRVPMKARRDELHRLSDLLGDDHDLAALWARLHQDPDRFGDPQPLGEFMALLDRARARLQFDAWGLGARLFAEPADGLVARVGRYWDIWSDDGGDRVLLTPRAVAEYTPSATG